MANWLTNYSFDYNYGNFIPQKLRDKGIMPHVEADGASSVVVRSNKTSGNYSWQEVLFRPTGADVTETRYDNKAYVITQNGDVDLYSKIKDYYIKGPVIDTNKTIVKKLDLTKVTKYGGTKYYFAVRFKIHDESLKEDIWYYYVYYQEKILQDIYFYKDVVSTNITKSAYEPQEAIDFSGFSLSFSVKNYRFNSNTGSEIATAVDTYNFADWNAVKSAGTGKIKYNEPTTFDDETTSQYATVTYVGISEIQVYDSTTSKISDPYTPLAFSQTLTSTPWISKVYSVTTVSGKDYRIYTGIQVGDDFLTAHKLILTKTNSLGTSKVFVIQEALVTDLMSKTIISETDSQLNFTYDISAWAGTGQTLTCSSLSAKTVKLATGNAKYDNLRYTDEYEVGTEITDIDLRTDGGYLKYSDGKLISLNDISYSEEPKFILKDEYGEELELPHTVGSYETSFTGKYLLNTVYYGDVSFNWTAMTTGQKEVENVEYENLRTTPFNPSEKIAFAVNGTDNVLKITLKSGLVEEYTQNQLFGIANRLDIDERYNNLTIKELGYGDFITTLYSTFYQRTLTQKITYIYNNSALKITKGSSFKSKVYINYDTPSFTDFDYTGLTIHKENHSNTINASGELETTVTDVSISLSDPNLHFSHDEVSKREDRSYPVTITYIDEYGMVLTAQVIIDVIINRVIRLEVEGLTGDSTTYYFMDGYTELEEYTSNKFHFPTGIQVYAVYNNPDEPRVLLDINYLRYYRHKDDTVMLNANSKIINEGSEPNLIYIKHKDFDIKSSYSITFTEDYPDTLTLLDTPMNFTLGNLLINKKDDFHIEVTFDSGFVKSSGFTDFEFEDSGYILSPKIIKIIYKTQGQSYPFALNSDDDTTINSKINFVNPIIDEVILDMPKFPYSYYNKKGTIDCSEITATIKYKDSSNNSVDYVEEGITFTTGTISSGHFTVTDTSSLLGTGFVFDGSTKINATITSPTVQITAPISFNVMSSISSLVTGAKSVNINVVEIGEIIGIHLVNANTVYEVGDLFLNDDDDTKISIWYKDGTEIKTLTMYLRDDFAGINITPLKGTKFLTQENSRNIVITSVMDSNINCSYNITVNAQNSSDTTIIHKWVAIKYSVDNRYYLVDISNTEVVNGIRVLNGELTLEKLLLLNRVYGYLEDIGNVNKSAKVILYNDYVADIDGSNNMEVTFPCYSEDNEKIVNNCHFGILFGAYNATNRLFVSGNTDIPNADWHSGQINTTNLDGDILKVNGNFSYISDESVMYYGETDNKVIGYDIVSNDKLLVLKNKSDKEKTVYFRTPVSIKAIDSSGNTMTDVSGDTLYQEEFSLVKGNNSVAGISPNSITNFNGDTLFLDQDKQLVGLDLTGIVGDNQRYANTRSKYIDEKLRGMELTKSFLWTNNKYLFMPVTDGEEYLTFITHYEKITNGQYEWWVVDYKNPSAFIEVDDIVYYANEDGELYAIKEETYNDITSMFANNAILGEDKDTIVVGNNIVNKMEEGKKYTFNQLSVESGTERNMYHSVANIRNDKTKLCDLYIDAQLNALVICGMKNGVVDEDRKARLRTTLKEEKIFYLNHYPNSSVISTSDPTTFDYYIKYRLIQANDIDSNLIEDAYYIEKLDNATLTWTKLTNLNALRTAAICYELDDEYEITDIDKTVSPYTFKLLFDGEVMDLVKYDSQTSLNNFNCVIKQYQPVDAYYITAPFSMGSLNLLKTIWTFTLTNDTEIPSQLSVGVANNKIPYSKTKVLAELSKDALGMDLNELSFLKIDFDKTTVPRTYTSNRAMPYQKFVCFAFLNGDDSNAVLSTMSLTYTIPYPSYGSD